MSLLQGGQNTAPSSPFSISVPADPWIIWSQLLVLGGDNGERLEDAG